MKKNKNFISKNNLLFLSISVLLIIFSTIFVPTIYKSVKERTYKESLSEERQANYDKMRIEYVNIKNRITGTEPFNTGNESNVNGIDVSPDDNYIRTFDAIKYTVEMGIIPNTNVSGVTEASVFKGGVIKVKGKLPNQGSTPLMRFVEDAWMKNVKITNDGTEIYAEYHVPDDVTITNANQNLSFTLNTDGYKKEITSDMLPIFEVWMEGNAPDGNSNTPSVITQDEKQLIISGKVNLDARISHSTGALFSASVDGKEGRYTNFALAVALYQPVSSFSDLRGVAYPKGPIEINLDASYKAVNINQAGSTYQEITSTTEKSFGILNGTSLNVHGYNGAIYDFYPERGRQKIDNYPAGKRSVGYSNDQSCLDSGDATISFSENRMTFVFDNYKISYNAFPESTTYGKTDKTSPKEGYFISEVFQLFMPLYDYNESTSYDYSFSLSVNSIECKGTDDSNYKIENGNDIVKTNNSASINFSTRAKGNFYQSVGLTHGGNQNWRDGRANALLGDTVETSFNFYAIDGPYDSSDRLISWDSSMVTLKKYDNEKWQNFVYTNGASSEYVSYKYGVYKEDKLHGVSDLNKLNSLTFDDFDWYDTAQEALDNGKIAAMHVHESRFGFRKYTSARLKFIVDNNIENIGKVAVFRQYCFAQSNDTLFKTYENRKYRPTSYDINGKVTLSHTPSEIGESLLITGVNTSINVSVTDKDSSSNLKKAYDVQDGEVHIKNIPKLYTNKVESETDRAVDSVLITTTLPNGLSYHSGSSNKEPKSITVNSDGTTTIVWQYNNWQINHDAPNYPEITFTADISASLSNNASLSIKSVIYSQEDNRDVELHRTSKYGIVISNLAGSKAIKEINKPLIETNEPFVVTSMLGNISDDDLINIKTLEILPTNNNGSSFNGNYTIKVKKLLDDQKIYYTTNDINNIGITKDSYGKNTIKDVDLETDSRWTEITLNDIIPSNATAIASTIEKVEATSEKYFELEIIPTNNKANDYYSFNFNATSDNFRQAIKSNTVVTRVVSRNISGLIFNDSNHNSIRDNDETLIKDIKVSILKDNQIINEAITTDGHYSFSNLSSGNYSIIFSNIPEKYGLVDKDKGNNDENDNDAFYENGNILIKISLPITSQMNEHEYSSLNNDLGLETSKVEINKIDSDNIPLKNAKFTVKKDDKYVKAPDGNYSELSSEKYEFETENTGNITIENLPIGNYVINETQAPKGYVIDNNNYILNVKKENGKFSTNKISVINDTNLKEVKLTVKHIFKDNGSEIISPIVNSFKYNSSYETNSLDNNYYQYKLVDVQGDTKGTITSDTEVIYYYTLKDATINIKYVDADTNKEIAKTSIINTKFSKEYDCDETEKDIKISDNYIRAYKNKTDNYKGIVKDNIIDVTYYYQKKDSKVDVILEKTGTNKIENSSEKISYEIVYKAKIKDYIGQAKIIIKDTLPYLIDENQSNINEGKYQDNTITWEENIDVNSYINDTVTITKNIELKYKDIDLNKDVIINNVSANTILDNKSISISEKYNTYIDVKGNIIVKYIDKKTNEEIAESVKNVGKIGNTYSPLPKQIVGYNLIETPLENKYSYKEETTEITYYYEKVKLKVETKVNGKGGKISGNEEVLYGNDSTKEKIKIVADTGYVVDKVLINGKDLMVSDNLTTIVLDNFIKMTDDKIVEVTFKEKPNLIVNVPKTASNSKIMIIGLIFILTSLITYIIIQNKKIKI